MMMNNNDEYFYNYYYDDDGKVALEIICTDKRRHIHKLQRYDGD